MQRRRPRGTAWAQLDGLIADPTWRLSLGRSTLNLKALDLDGRVVAPAPHALPAVHDADASPLGQDWSGLWPEPLRTAMRGVLQRAVAGASTQLRGELPDAQGCWVPQHVVVGPLCDPTQRVIGVMIASAPRHAGSPPAPPQLWCRQATGDWAPLMTPGTASGMARARVDGALKTPVEASPWDGAGGLVGVLAVDDAARAWLETELCAAGFIPMPVADVPSLRALRAQLALQALVTQLPASTPGHDGVDAVVVEGLAPVLDDDPTPAPVHRLGPGWLASDLAGAVALAVRWQRRRSDLLSQRWRTDLLRDRIRHPGLRQALDAWWALHVPGQLLPDCEHATALLRSRESMSFIASVEHVCPEPVFRFEWMGSALEKRFGAPADGATIAGIGDAALGGLHRPYSRAVSGLPCLDWARYRLGRHGTAEFERLILPLSLDGERVSHLVGLVAIDQRLAMT